MTYTPGPWTFQKAALAGPKAENDYLITAEIGIVVLHIAEVFQYQSHVEQDGPSLANAHLIAAAPVLLEACEKAARYLFNLYVNDSSIIDYEEIKRLEAAIARAKGE